MIDICGAKECNITREVKTWNSKIISVHGLLHNEVDHHNEEKRRQGTSMYDASYNGKKVYDAVFRSDTAALVEVQRIVLGCHTPSLCSKATVDVCCRSLGKISQVDKELLLVFQPLLDDVFQDEYLFTA
ncbi:hypothetical protein CHS0354_021452 [Potamilus streckersoni]|uniref:Uncharacterized protein n=1 Tax=Potamilus streckersoni TaxID=2493646 RepID=A0AAE0S1K7_9BIVA|nr:hypothetical protein CHS0354_021452 [Potamilus streckersoni]